jgi:hypothetical protein
MNKLTMWAIIIVALLVGAYIGYYYEKQKFVKIVEVQRVDMQRQIDGLRNTVAEKDVQLNALQPTPTATEKEE